MSYDLDLFPKAPFDQAAFAAWFGARPHFQLSGDGDQAEYDNSDTGVYFSFEFSDGSEDDGELEEDDDDEESDEDWPEGPHVAFNINFFRPHVFALEAAPELAAFARHFSCEVRDPQMDGMGESWSEEGFLRGWSRGNEFAYEVMVRGDGGGVAQSSKDAIAGALRSAGCLVAQSDLIEAVWRWNRGKEALQAEVGDEYFVPALLWGAAPFARIFDTPPCLVVAWGPGTPILIPNLATHAILGVAEPGSSGGLQALLDIFKPKAKREPVRHYLAPLDELRAGGGFGDPELGVGAVRVPHGPEGLAQASLQRLAQGWPANQAKNNIRLRAAGQMRNREIYDRMIAGGG